MVHIWWLSYEDISSASSMHATGISSYSLDSHLSLTQLTLLIYSIMMNKQRIHTVHSLYHLRFPLLNIMTWQSSLRSKQKIFWVRSTVSDSKIESFNAWCESVTTRCQLFRHTYQLIPEKKKITRGTQIPQTRLRA